MSGDRGVRRVPPAPAGPVVVLGVDPGTQVTGYGIIRSHRGRMSVLAAGAITSDSGTPLPDRLRRIFERLNREIRVHHPGELAIETAFYGKNAQSALKLGHARGVAMLAAVSHDIPTSEYSPREVKKAVVGSGNASKEQVQYMVASMLGMRKTPEHYDTTDALAVAICHVHRMKPGSPAFRNWKSFIASHPELVARQAGAHRA